MGGYPPIYFTKKSDDMKKTKEITRKKLLESAAHEFSIHGYEESSIDDISINAGYGKGTIYNYFKNKQDVFLSVIQSSFNNLVESIKESIKDIDTTEEKLKEAIKTDVRYVINNSSLLMTIIREAYIPDEERSQYVIAETSTIFELYLSLIEDGIKEGCFPEETNPVLSASAIMGMCENLSLSNVLLKGAFGSEDELAQWIIDFIFNGMK